MTEILAGLPFGNISLSGLVTMFVLLIYTGRLVPRQALLDKQAECDRLWTSIADSTEANKILTGTVAKLTAHTEGIDRSFRELQLEATRTAAVNAVRAVAEDAAPVAEGGSP